MSVGYILQQVGFKIGLNPSVTGERSVLLRYLKTAAKEVYQTSDMAGSLEEQQFRVNPNQTIAFPHYIGQVRAMRQSYEHAAGKLSQLRARYNQFNWEDEWRNWRVKGLQTLQTSISNQSALIISVAEVENPAIVVTITGPTDGAALTTETITMNSTSIQTTNNFLDVTSFTKDRVNNFDVRLSDVDDNSLSYIPNNQLKALFQIIDVSSYPFVVPVSNIMLSWFDVLYKKALPELTNDADEFPAPGYDEVIIAKMLQLGYEEQGNINLAAAFQAKSTNLLAQIHEDANRGTDDMVAMVENPHDRMLHRTGFGRDWRQAYRIIGR